MPAWRSTFHKGALKGCATSKKKQKLGPPLDRHEAERERIAQRRRAAVKEQFPKARSDVWYPLVVNGKLKAAEHYPAENSDINPARRYRAADGVIDEAVVDRQRAGAKGAITRRKKKFENDKKILETIESEEAERRNPDHPMHGKRVTNVWIAKQLKTYTKKIQRAKKPGQ